jgi:hypothetical protein
MKTKRRTPGRSAAGRNPIQEAAIQNQTPRWSKNQGKPRQESIPSGLLPHPLVDAKLQEAPPGSEGREPITGDDSGEWEDEPAG